MNCQTPNKLTAAIRRFVSGHGRSGILPGALLGGASVFGSVHNAQAQQLEEIIVTAERREANLQDTPLSVLTFSDRQLESQAIDGLFDLAAAVPNLAINPGRGSGPAEPEFKIRGVGGGGVALYIDGIYFPSTSRSALRTADLESIEILRGPQGTLFGRNSTGGAIRAFTRKPTDSYAAEVGVEVGEYGMVNVEGRVNVPLSENVFIKGELANLSQDGYIERLGVSGDQAELGDVDDTIGSLALRWLAAPNVTVDVKGRYEESDRNPVVRDLEELRVTDQGLLFHYRELQRHLMAAGEPALVNDDPRLLLDDYTVSGYCFLFDNDPQTFESDCNTGYDSEYRQVTGNIQWDINANHGFVFNGGYQDVEVRQAVDWLTIGAEIRYEDYTSQALMLEGVLSSALLNGKLDLTSGINYYSEENDEFSEVLRNHSPNLMADTRDIYGDSFEDDALGIFSQGVFHLTDATNLTVGLRYTVEDTSAILREWESGDFDIAGWKECSTDSSTGGGGVIVRDPNCMVEVSGSEEYNVFDWKAGIDHHFGDNVMLYVSGSKAYRSGAWSHTLSPTVNPANVTIVPTEPEKLVNVEAGVRSELFDYRLRLNFTLFDMDFTNRQGPSLVTMGDSAQVIIVNNGDVDVSGWELDASLAITDSLSAFVSAGFTDADLVDPEPPNSVNLPGVPEYNYNVGGSYVKTLGNGELSVNLNYVYVDEMHSTPGVGREDTHVQDSYGVLNGNIQYVFGNEREWAVSLSGTNLTDESYGLSELRFGRFFMGPPPGTNYMQLADRGMPRMVFGKVSRSF